MSIVAERRQIINQTFWNLFDAFENSFVVSHDPIIPNVEWLAVKRTLSVRMGCQTGHTTFAKELAAKHNAFLLTMDHEAVDGEFYFTHSRLREMYYKFESPNIPNLFVIDDAYQFGGRFESLVLRLIKCRDTLGEDYLRTVRFVLLN